MDVLRLHHRTATDSLLRQPALPHLLVLHFPHRLLYLAGAYATPPTLPDKLTHPDLDPSFCTQFAADGGAPIVGGEAGPGRKFAILCEGLFKEQSDGFRGLVGYVLGGYVARAFTMWYVRRKNYAAFCGACRNLTLNLAAALPMDHTSAPGTISAAELHAVRRNLGRWTVLAHELGTLKGRGAIDSAQAEEYLTQIGMLHEGEWAAMVHGDRHTTVLWWVQLAAQRLCKRGVIEAAGLRSVQEGVTGYRAQANDLMSSLDRDIPYPYASLLGMIVKTNVILMTLWRTFELYLNLCGTMTGAQNWMASGNPECVMVGNPTFPNQNALYFMTMIIVQLVTLFLWNMSYKAMYDLGKVLHNPFGNRVIDVAHETIHAGLRQLAEELLGEAVHHLPPEMPQDESNE